MHKINDVNNIEKPSKSLCKSEFCKANKKSKAINIVLKFKKNFKSFIIVNVRN